MEYNYVLIKLHKDLPLKIIIPTSDSQAFTSRHWHDIIETSYVLSGKIDHIYIDGKEYESREDDIVVINSNAIHSFSVNRGRNRKTVILLSPNEFIKAIPHMIKWNLTVYRLANRLTKK